MAFQVMRNWRPAAFLAMRTIWCRPAWRVARLTTTAPRRNAKLPPPTTRPLLLICNVAVPGPEAWKRMCTIQPDAVRVAVIARGATKDAAGRNAPQRADRHVFQTISCTLPAESLRVSWNRYVPARATLNGPTVTLPACGANVNAFTSRPFSERRRSAEAGRLRKKRRLTAQPTAVRATSGLPRLPALKVPPALVPGRLKLADRA